MPHAAQDLAALKRCAEARGGVVSDADLRACGFSAAAVRRRILDGTWWRWGRAVVLGPPPPGSSGAAGADLIVDGLPERGLGWALQLTYGAKAVISGAPALWRAGWQVPTRVLVVAVHHKPHLTLPGVHVTRRQPGRVLVLSDGRRYAPATEALLDALRCVDDAAARDLLDAALQRRVITPDAFAEAAQARLGSGRTGATALRALVERALSGSRSEAEQRMGALLRRSRTGPWAANHPVRDESGRIVAEIDFAHQGLRIAIEVDGRAYHSDRRSFERDRQRQNTLVVRGWLVLRFTWEQITQRPEEVLAAIDAAVRMRLAG